MAERSLPGSAGDARLRGRIPTGAPAPRFGALIIGDEILSGKRQDRHFAKAIEILGRRGLTLSWSMYLPDEPDMIAEVLTSTMGRPDVVFSFGGIGATPDDHTRQCAAKAAGVALALHPDAKREIEARFGAEAYPKRIEMGVFPVGSRIIPNPYNRVPGFSYRRHHFLPGFPEMAWPMMEWVLDNEYREFHRATPPVDVAIIVKDAGESQLIDLMNGCIARFPDVKLFSLPSFTPAGRRIELGVKGEARLANEALDYLKQGVTKLGFGWEERGEV
ncbi:MAG TPA: molybdopterin-binding protein [Burkholderiales bacterium]|jgi:molybdopterin-biosynthesis enzyme MoeA-like protein|nr:molybdopterin-binding protein [Burkholderiales bacterium]